MALLALTLSIAACGDESEDEPADEPAHEEPQEQPEKASEPDPLSCLEDADLSDVEARGKNFWRGSNPDATLVRVEKFASKAEAREAVELADVVASEQAGAYGVFGPVLDKDTGSTAAVARCLRGD